MKSVHSQRGTSKPFLMTILVFSMVLHSFFSTLYAQEQVSQDITKTQLIGNWKGEIVGETRSIAIIWRFEESTSGELIGFMGPASRDVATLPMQDLKITNTTITFGIQSQGYFSGTVSSAKVTGIWGNGKGKEATMEMLRKTTDPGALGTTNDIHKNIAQGNIQAVKTFVAEGNDINKEYSNEYPLLFHAIKQGANNTIATYLLEHGANPNLDFYGITPLIFAITYRNYPLIKALIAHQAKVNYVSSERQNALLVAIENRNVKAISLLLAHGADPSVKIYDDLTIADFAKNDHQKEVLEALGLPYEGITDGPYIIGDEAVWICKGKEHRKRLRKKGAQVIKHCGKSTTIRPFVPSGNSTLEHNGNFAIAAASDIHGQHALFIKLLKRSAIIDQKGKWSFGTGHFVVTGDIFDRGAQVMETLWFLYDLEKQATKHGGKLHVLLGNHDVMVLNGNLRSVHPKYLETAKQLEKPYHTLFSKGSILGDWLRDRPVLTKINGILFTHGGFHPDLADKGISLEKINREFKQQLIENELTETRNDLGKYLHENDGPIYYRGYFRDGGATAKEIDRLLNHFQATTIVVGHTTQRHIETRYQGKVIAIDANMKSGKTGELLLWESGKFTRATLSGEKLPLLSND